MAVSRLKTSRSDDDVVKGTPPPESRDVWKREDSEVIKQAVDGVKKEDAELAIKPTKTQKLQRVVKKVKEQGGYGTWRDVIARAYDEGDLEIAEAHMDVKAAARQPQGVDEIIVSRNRIQELLDEQRQDKEIVAQSPWQLEERERFVESYSSSGTPKNPNKTLYTWADSHVESSDSPMFVNLHALKRHFADKSKMHDRTPFYKPEAMNLAFLRKQNDLGPLDFGDHIATNKHGVEFMRLSDFKEVAHEVVEGGKPIDDSDRLPFDPPTPKKEGWVTDWLERHGYIKSDDPPSPPPQPQPPSPPPQPPPQPPQPPPQQSPFPPQPPTPPKKAPPKAPQTPPAPSKDPFPAAPSDLNPVVSKGFNKQYEFVWRLADKTETTTKPDNDDFDPYNNEADAKGAFDSLSKNPWFQKTRTLPDWAKIAFVGKSKFSKAFFTNNPDIINAKVSFKLLMHNVQVGDEGRPLKEVIEEGGWTEKQPQAPPQQPQGGLLGETTGNQNPVTETEDDMISRMLKAREKNAAKNPDAETGNVVDPVCPPKPPTSKLRGIL